MRHALQWIVRNVSRLAGKNGEPAPARVRRQASSDATRIAMVAVLENAQDRRVLDEVCERNRWEVSFADAGDEARQLSRRLKPQIVLFDRDAGGADWRHVVASLAATSGGACVLLISRVADDTLWNEVVSNGGYDVLAKPLREHEVLRAVRFAWSYWHGMRQSAATAKK